MRRPSFQFYPDDWCSNKNLRRCTHAEKGMWIDLMCIMHDGDPYGVLKWPLDQIARAIMVELSDILPLVDKGVLKGSDQRLTKPLIYVPRSGRKNGMPVILLEAQPGPIWFSSRMVEDEHKRIILESNLHKGKKLTNGATHADDTASP